MSRVERLLFTCGLVVLACDLIDDADILRMSLERAFDPFSLRMIAGHCIREGLVVTSLVALRTRADWAMPFALASALHGLFFRSGYFLGSNGFPPLSAPTIITIFDMLWRAALLIWVIPLHYAGLREEVTVRDDSVSAS